MGTSVRNEGDAMQKKIYEHIKTKSTLNKVREKKMPFDWSINPYRGCAHGCSFCYARAFQSFIGLAANDEFQNHIMIKNNAADALEAQLSKLVRRFKGNIDDVSRYVGLVAIGTATDPYQPIEGRACITRECLKVLTKYRIPVTITTRSPLILRDLDLLTEMNVSSVNISLNSLNRDVTRRFEPATADPMKRLETMQQLNEQGIKAGVFIAPILPYITDDLEEMESLIRTVKNHKASFAMTSLLRLTPDVKSWFFQSLRDHFPELVSLYAKLYPSTYAERSYTEPLMKHIQALVVKYGLSNSLPEAEYRTSCPASQLFQTSPSSLQPKQIPEQLSFEF
jgi:DNA repair photolyase